MWSALALGVVMHAAGWSVASAAPAKGLETTVHRERAAEVTAAIQERFHNRRTGLYAAKAGGREPDFMWGNGVMFSALVGASRHDKDYERVMRRFFEAMDAYWDVQAKIPGYEPARVQGGHDKYYDDNAWMVLTFLEAYEQTGEVRYKKRAEDTLQFVLSGWDDEAGGGIWWHEEHKGGCKNTCANAPAALGCFRMARTEPGPRADELNGWGDRITVWTVEKLQAPDGLFYDSFKVDSGRMNHAKLTYNVALMIRNFIALHARTGKAYYLTEAGRMARAAGALCHRGGNVYRDAWKWAHLQVEADLELYRWTGEQYLLDRAVANAEAHYAAWKKEPPEDLITHASLARELWLLADLETAEGRAFWKRADRGKEASPR